ncbi:MAG: integrase arm-type DNA-binding domain-containing protein [Thiolinea sp.]
MKTKLTAKAIARIKVPTDRAYMDYSDQDAVGLMLRVYRTGEKAFVYRYRLKGKQREYTIADADLTTLAEARKEHAALRAKVKAGTDVKQERDLQLAIIASVPTVAKFAEIYIEMYAKPNKKTWMEDKRLLDADIIPFIGDLPIDKVIRPQINAVLDKKQAIGSLTVRNRLISLLSKYFNYAIERGYLEHNPVTKIKRTKEYSRERVLSNSDIQFFWQQTDVDSSFSNANRLAMRLILVTGQRPGEVAQMHTDQIQGDVWRMETTKNGLPHEVPLTPLALQIIGEALPHSCNGLVFANTKGAVMHKTILPKCMRTMPWETAPATPHDLRRTCITGISRLGFNRLVQDKIANHVDNSIGGIYDRYDYMKEKRDALLVWSNELMSVCRANTTI